MATVGSLVVNVTADAAGFEQGAKKAESSLKGLRGQLKSFQKDMKVEI